MTTMRKTDSSLHRFLGGNVTVGWFYLSERLSMNKDGVRIHFGI